jgi:hypothetical protein
MTRKKQAQAAEEAAATGDVFDEAIAAQRAAGQAAAGESPAAGAEPTAPRAEGETAKRPYKPVKSWTENYNQPLRYEKFTDDRSHKIMFRFKLPDGQAKPPEEVLALMRAHTQTPEGGATGLQFRDLRSHGKVWVIPNDAEGRDLADKIDFKLSQLAVKMQAAERTPG